MGTRLRNNEDLDSISRAGRYGPALRGSSNLAKAIIQCTLSVSMGWCKLFNAPHPSAPQNKTDEMNMLTDEMHVSIYDPLLLKLTGVPLLLSGGRSRQDHDKITNFECQHLKNRSQKLLGTGSFVIFEEEILGVFPRLRKGVSLGSVGRIKT